MSSVLPAASCSVPLPVLPLPVRRSVAPLATAMLPSRLPPVPSSTSPPPKVTLAVPAPTSKARAMRSSSPVLDSVTLPLAGSAMAGPAASVPVPLLLVMVAPLSSVMALATLAPPRMSSVLAPSAMLPLPAVPLPLSASVPALTVVPPL